jgi:hypothetical protein
VGSRRLHSRTRRAAYAPSARDPLRNAADATTDARALVVVQWSREYANAHTRTHRITNECVTRRAFLPRTARPDIPTHHLAYTPNSLTTEVDFQLLLACEDLGFTQSTKLSCSALGLLCGIAKQLAPVLETASQFV